MEKTEFKKSMGKILKQFGFEYAKKAYYYSNDELIAVISLQKSNFDDGFYLNYGFLIKELNNDIEFPKDNMCDVRGRLGIRNNNITAYDFYPDKCTPQMLEEALTEGVCNIILPVLNEGLIRYYEIFPEAIAMMTLKAKNYLRFT